MYRPRSQHIDRARLKGIDRTVLTALLVLAVTGAIIVIPTPLDGAALFAPLAAFAVLVHPVLLPLAIVASVPVQDAIPLPEGVPITATRVMTAAALMALPFVLIRRSEPLRSSRFLLAIIALLGVMTFSLINAASLAAGFEELYRWAAAGFVFWLVLQFVQTRRHLISAIALGAALALIQGGIGIGQSLTGAGPASFEIGSGISRSFGTFGMPNSFAAYMEVAALPLIPLTVWAAGTLVRRARAYRLKRVHGFLASASERRQLWLAIGLFLLLLVGMAVGLAAIAMSFSRGGWLGSIAAVSVMVLLLGRRAVVTSAVLASLISLTLFLAAPGAVLGEIQERFGQLVDQLQIGDVRRVAVTGDNFATVERMAHWQTAIGMWDEYPWTGVGAGNFDERFTEFAVHPWFDESQGHAHNYYLHVLAETGVPGLLVYLVFLGAALFIGWRAYRSKDSLARAIGIGALGMTSALIVHNVFENLHVLNISAHMMLVWGMAVVAVRLSEAQPSVTDGTTGNERLGFGTARSPGLRNGSSDTSSQLREQS